MSPWGAPLEIGAVLRLHWLPNTQLRPLTRGVGWSGGRGGLLWLPEGLPAVGQQEVAGGGPQGCAWGSSGVQNPHGPKDISHALSAHSHFLAWRVLPPGVSPQGHQYPPSPSRVRKGNGVLLVPQSGQLQGTRGWGIPGPRGTAGILEWGGRKKQPKTTRGEGLMSGSDPCLQQSYLGAPSLMVTSSVLRCGPPGCWGIAIPGSPSWDHHWNGAGRARQGFFWAGAPALLQQGICTRQKGKADTGRVWAQTGPAWGKGLSSTPKQR